MCWGGRGRTETRGEGRGCSGGVFVHFVQMKESAAAAGSPVGKISAALWRGVEPAITINVRGRGLTGHTKERKMRAQTKNKGRDRGMERQTARDITREGGERNTWREKDRGIIEEKQREKERETIRQMERIVRESAKGSINERLR